MGTPAAIPEFYSKLPTPDLEEDHHENRLRSFPSYGQCGHTVATAPRVSARPPADHVGEGFGAGSGRAPVLLSLRPREPTPRHAPAIAREERSALSNAVPITGDIIVLLAGRQMRFDNEVGKARQLIARLQDGTSRDADSDHSPTFALPFRDTREVLTHAVKLNVDAQAPVQRAPADDASSVMTASAPMCRSTQVDVSQDKRRVMSDLSNTCVISALLGGFASMGLTIDMARLRAGHNAQSDLIRQTGLLLWLITFTSAHVW